MFERQAQRRLLWELRQAQGLLAAEESIANLWKAYSRLERAVCWYLGATCRHCGLPSTGDDLLCDGCRQHLAAKAS